jgi:Uma2 family endonuclease
MKTLIRWSLEDYHRLIAAGLLAQRQVELLEGDLIEMPPEGPRHYSVTANGTRYLQLLLGTRALVRQAGPISLTDSEPQPDLAIVQGSAQAYLEQHPGPADILWLVEISQTTLAYDLGDKARLYARTGIPEYWVADLGGNRLLVHRNPEGDRYAEITEKRQGRLSPLAFPELSLDVERLLSGLG